MSADWAALGTLPTKLGQQGERAFWGPWEGAPRSTGCEGLDSVPGSQGPGQLFVSLTLVSFLPRA